MKERVIEVKKGKRKISEHVTRVPKVETLKEDAFRFTAGGVTITICPDLAGRISGAYSEWQYEMYG